MASLSFSEKIRILEKLRVRSLVLADAREKLAAKRREGELDWSNCNLVEVDALRSNGRPVVKGTGVSVQDIIANYESGASISEVSEQFGVDVKIVKNLLQYANQRHPLARLVE